MERVVFENVRLKKCPFCGSDRVHEEYLTDLMYASIECADCGALISFAGCNDPIVAKKRYERRSSGWISAKTPPPAPGTYIISGRLKYKWEAEWEYFTDAADFTGDRYITFNDWDEGQDVEIIAWMPLPEPIKEGQWTDQKATSQDA